ncbi:MAG: hypothetical protein HC803_02405 [Saprospiraceae bacterium]|nr:hypothetical protein [Saprospiraceae bacterium]
MPILVRLRIHLALIWRCHFIYNQIRLNQITAKSSGFNDKGQLIVAVNETKVGSLSIPKIILENKFSRDTIAFKTSVSSIADIFSALNINGQLFLTDNQFQIHLDASDLYISEDKWLISDNNYIQFGSGYVHTNNFVLKSGEQVIALNSFGKKGLQLDVSNLPFSWIQRFVKIPFLTFDGKVNAQTRVKNLFDLSQDSISSTVQMDSFFINNDYFGKLNIAASVPKLSEALNFNLEIEKNVIDDEDKIETQSLNVGGKYYLPTAQEKYKPNSFAFSARTRNFPFEVIEYFVQGISKSKGKVNANLFFSGDVKKPEAKGTVRLYEAGTRIDFLQTFYRLEEIKITAKDNFFDFSGNKLIDKFGNEASVIGGINHKILKILNWH